MFFVTRPNALLALMADEAAAYSLDDAAWLDESGRGSVLEEELSPGDGGNPDSGPGEGFISTTSGMGSGT